MKRIIKVKTTSLLILSLMILLTASAASADTLHLPSGLKEIDDEAFMNVTSLDTVVIPEGVTSIGPRAFSGTSITQLTLPASLQQVGDDAATQ